MELKTLNLIMVTPVTSTTLYVSHMLHDSVVCPVVARHPDTVDLCVKPQW